MPSDCHPPELIFGLASLHRLPLAAQRQRLLARALEVGFRAFDSAPAYGNGLDEVELGLALRGRRHEIAIATKYGIPMPLYGAWGRPLFPVLRVADKLANPEYRKRYQRRDFRPAEAVRSLEGSLKRLRTDYVDVFFIHEPVAPIAAGQLEEIGEVAARLKREGKIRAFGLAGSIRVAREVVESPSVDVLQLPLVEARSGPLLVGKATIAYGLFSVCRKSGVPRTSFVSFVKALQQGWPGLGLILSSHRVPTVASFRELFQ